MSCLKVCTTSPSTPTLKAERHRQRLGGQRHCQARCRTDADEHLGQRPQFHATRLAAHPAAVFLPDFDPGALETLLALAVTHNNRDLWAILPKKQGSVEPVQLATYADQQGTLDGKPITVHHLVATIAGGKTDLFSGPESQLLQAEMPQSAFALVRKGFVLTPPAKPDAPPEPPPATPSQ